MKIQMRTNKQCKNKKNKKTKSERKNIHTLTHMKMRESEMCWRVWRQGRDGVACLLCAQKINNVIKVNLHACPLMLITQQIFSEPLANTHKRQQVIVSAYFQAVGQAAELRSLQHARVYGLSECVRQAQECEKYAYMVVN